MKTKFLVPLVMGVLAFTAPSWADPTGPIGTPVDNSTEYVFVGPDAPSLAPQPELFMGDFPSPISDALPMFSLDLRRVDVGIDFLVQQTAVGPKSIDEVGVMLSFKSR